MKYKKSKSYKTWDANDIALMLYAKNHKGLTYSQLAELLDSTVSSVSGQITKTLYPERYSKAHQKKVNKAEILSFAVHSGQYPDHRDRWDKLISKVTGVKYQYKDQEKKVEKPIEKEREEVVEKSVETPEVEELPENVLSITINTKAVLAIVKAWKG